MQASATMNPLFESRAFDANPRLQRLLNHIELSLDIDAFISARGSSIAIFIRYMAGPFGRTRSCSRFWQVALLVPRISATDSRVRYHDIRDNYRELFIVSGL